MAKFEKLNDLSENGIETYWFQCPGCRNAHPVRTAGPGAWQWNGDVDRPTIQPSLVCDPNGQYRCHSFITDGQIQFLSDCFHELKNQTVEIPDWQPEFDCFGESE